MPLEQQRFTWRELVQPPYNKLMDGAFTRVRVILMNGIMRRVEQHQQTLVNWLNPADQNPLETTIGFEQIAIASTARRRSA